MARNFNPRSPYGERLGRNYGLDSTKPISIHAPLTGSDVKAYDAARKEEFQSTLPLRGATVTCIVIRLRPSYFNPRSPYGERHPYRYLRYKIGTFQSTLPLRGATETEPPADTEPTHFNPRSPYGERPEMVDA